MSRWTIVIDSDPGEDIAKTARTAIETARDPVVRKQFAGAMPRVVVEHNDTRVHVWHDDSELKVVERWHLQREQDRRDARKARERAVANVDQQTAALYEELLALRTMLAAVRAALPAIREDS